MSVATLRSESGEPAGGVPEYSASDATYSHQQQQEQQQQEQACSERNL
jgi:hypothetical protein